MDSPETVQFPCPACRGLLTVPKPLEILRGPCPLCGVGILYDPATGNSAVDPAGIAPIPDPTAPPASAPPQQSPPPEDKLANSPPRSGSDHPIPQTTPEPENRELPGARTGEQRPATPLPGQRLPGAQPKEPQLFDRPNVPAQGNPASPQGRQQPAAEPSAPAPAPAPAAPSAPAVQPQTQSPQESRVAETPPVHLGRLLAFILLGLFFLMLAGAALFALVSSLRNRGEGEPVPEPEPIEETSADASQLDAGEPALVPNDEVAELADSAPKAPRSAPVERIPPGNPTPDAESLLQTLLSNADGQNLLPYILRGGELRSTVTDYYRANPPEGSRYQTTDFTKFELGQQDSVRGLSCYLLPAVEGNSPQAALFVRSGEDGNHRADWETFVQTRDRALEAFMETPQIGARKEFRVNMKRVHHLGARVPEAGNYIFVLVKSPTQANWDGAREFYTPMISDLGESFAAKLGWGEGVAATTWLTWKEIDGQPQLAIDVLTCWEYLGVGNDSVENISDGPCLAVPQ